MSYRKSTMSSNIIRIDKFDACDKKTIWLQNLPGLLRNKQFINVYDKNDTIRVHKYFHVESNNMSR